MAWFKPVRKSMIADLKILLEALKPATILSIIFFLEKIF